MRRDSPKSLNKNGYFSYLSDRRSLDYGSYRMPISQLKGRKNESGLDDITYVQSQSICSNIDPWDGYNELTLNSFGGKPPLIHYCNKGNYCDMLVIGSHPYHENLALGLSEDP